MFWNSNWFLSPSSQGSGVESVQPHHSYVLPAGREDAEGQAREGTAQPDTITQPQQGPVQVHTHTSSCWIFVPAVLSLGSAFKRECSGACQQRLVPVIQSRSAGTNSQSYTLHNSVRWTECCLCSAVCCQFPRDKFDSRWSPFFQQGMKDWLRIEERLQISNIIRDVPPKISWNKGSHFPYWEREN